MTRRTVVAVVAAVLVVVATAVLLWGRLSPDDGTATGVDDEPGTGSEGTPGGDAVPDALPDEPVRWDQLLTWAPPEIAEAEVLEITEPGSYRLEADRAYRIEAPETIDGAVELRGGGDIVWIGGHMRIPDQGAGPVPNHPRRALMITDGDDARAGRVVHLEGLRIDGPDLAEGINTHAPDTIVQLQNLHIAGVHFRNADDRDGTAGWETTHPM
jgi:hypothetical protein